MQAGLLILQLETPTATGWQEIGLRGHCVYHHRKNPCRFFHRLSFVTDLLLGEILRNDAEGHRGGCQELDEVLPRNEARALWGILQATRRQDPCTERTREARRQLAKDYIHSAMLDHLEIDYGRFRKLIGKVQRHLNALQSQEVIPFDGVPVHLAQGHATTL
jgi:hypothetical protein